MAMVIYLSPRPDEAHAADMLRLGDRTRVLVLMLGFSFKLTVKEVVHHMSGQRCTTLVVPDDYHRHNELIEHAKACAYHMGLAVMPLSRYLLKHPPAPAPKQHPVHANAEPAGAAGGVALAPARDSG